jgi:large subunit ribosomal protein L37e
MTKGTPAFGKHNKVLHTICKRCGRHSFNMNKEVCGTCGFGKTKKITSFSWRWKEPTGKGNRKNWKVPLGKGIRKK